jgi:hypothetical protein
MLIVRGCRCGIKYLKARVFFLGGGVLLHLGVRCALVGSP